MIEIKLTSKSGRTKTVLFSSKEKALRAWGFFSRVRPVVSKSPILAVSAIKETA